MFPTFRARVAPWKKSLREEVTASESDQGRVASLRFIALYQAKINAVLQREQAIIRRDVRQDTRNVRLKIIQDAIATRQEARQFLLQEKRRVRSE